MQTLTPEDVGLSLARLRRIDDVAGPPAGACEIANVT